MRYFITCCLLACLLAPGPALANGYDTYANPLAWSPDGLHCAAITGAQWPYHSEAIPGELQLLDSHGHSEAILAGALASPCFSADSAWLAVVLDGDLVAYNLAAGNAVWLTVRGDVLDCRFAPQVDPAHDPRIIFTAGARFYGCEIYSMPFDPEGQAQPELATNTGASVSCFGPAPSPGGTHFLFLHQFGFDSPADGAVYERIYWLADAAQPEQQLTLPQRRADDYHESNIVWLGEDTVLFQRGGWGDWQLVRKQLPGGPELIVLTDAQQPSASADGAWLAFTRRDARAKEAAEYDWDVPGSVWVQKTGTRRLRRLSADGVDAGYPAVSPDGAHVAWLEWDGAAVQLRQARLGGSER